MILLDVNVLVAVHRQDHADHGALLPWLTRTLAAREPVGVPDDVFVSVVRIVTNARVFKRPSSLEEVLAFVADVRAAPRFLPVAPGESFFAVFRELCLDVRPGPADVPDTALAALAMTNGAVLATRDGGFVRYPRLTWMDPVDGAVRRNPAGSP